MICPNCENDMELHTINFKFDSNLYDKWICKDCIHIIVLDYRG